MTIRRLRINEWTGTVFAGSDAGVDPVLYPGELAVDDETGEIRMAALDGDDMPWSSAPTVGGMGGSRSTFGDYYRPLRGIAPGITSAITNGESKATTFVPWSSAEGQYRYVGCVPESMSGDPSLGVNNNTTKAALFVLQSLTMEFWSNATDLRIHGYGIGKADVWALVDDMHIMAGWQHINLADNYYTWALTQGTAVWRKYRVSVSGPFSGISFNSGADIVPTTPGFQLAVIGDSLVQGNVNTANAVAPGTAGLLTAGAVFGEFEQITGLDVWRYGIYGTGYVAYSDFGADGPYGSAARMAKVNAGPDFDAIIAFGSVNDGPATASAIVAAANTTWTSIKAGNPNSTLIVAGMEDLGGTNTDIDTRNTALLDAARAHPDVSGVVDLRAANFVTGTGYDGSPANNGNADAFVSADATHPTHAGCRYWAQNLASLLKTVGV